MAFLAKALFRWNKSLKNTDISILSNFLAISFQIFFISSDFAKYYLHTKVQINWTIQTEITEGVSICPPLAIPICKKPGLFRVNSLMLGSFSNLVLLKLDTILYPDLAYAKGFTEKFGSLTQILFKV